MFVGDLIMETSPHRVGMLTNPAVAPLFIAEWRSAVPFPDRRSKGEPPHLHTVNSTVQSLWQSDFDSTPNSRFQ